MLTRIDLQRQKEHGAATLASYKRQEAADKGVFRREFVGLAAASIIFGKINRPALASESGMEFLSERWGATGEKVSLIGLGGYHLGKQKQTSREEIRIIRNGIATKAEFSRTLLGYNGGEAKFAWGKALRDGYRQKAF